MSVRYLAPLTTHLLRCCMCEEETALLTPQPCLSMTDQEADPYYYLVQHSGKWALNISWEAQSEPIGRDTGEPSLGV